MESNFFCLFVQRTVFAVVVTGVSRPFKTSQPSDRNTNCLTVVLCEFFGGKSKVFLPLKLSF